MQPQDNQQQPMGGQAGGGMGGFNPDQNPFAGITSQPQAQPQPEGTPVASQAGESGDNLGELIKAINSLHNYITNVTDMKEIGVIRSIIQLLTQLANRDQQNALQKPQMLTPQVTQPTQ